MSSTTARLLRNVAIVAGSLAGATGVVALLERQLGLRDASATFLVAVIVCALTTGTAGAVAAAVGGFLVYDYLFTAPYNTFAIREPGILLSLVLLLFVGIVVGRLAARERDRADTAIAREREARTLFRVSRTLATRESTTAVLHALAEVLREQAGMRRVWMTLGGDPVTERVVADTEAAPPPPQFARHQVLQRMPGDEPARWARVQRPERAAHHGPDDAYRVRIEAQGEQLGAIWALRDRSRPAPDRSETRLLGAAADQIGQAFAQDRAADASRTADVARQSDALKSALLQSVSHDLRTPLATIRAAAGSLRPGVGLSRADTDASADAIEREVEYLNRLVTNLLDLSRIEAGGLRADRDIFDLDDLLTPALERARHRSDGRTLEVDLAGPPVLVDPVLLDEAVTNLLDNALKHGGAGTRIRVSADALDAGRVRLTVEDDGPGAPPESLPRLFEKFYRVPGRGRDSRSGTGVGLAVVRGLVEAMGGTSTARRSALGGLAIDLDLPAAALPAALRDDRQVGGKPAPSGEPAPSGQPAPSGEPAMPGTASDASESARPGETAPSGETRP